MVCKTCGTKNLLSSDLVGDRCVECFDTDIKKKGYWECIKCGKESKTLTNEMCNECFGIWKFY